MQNMFIAQTEDKRKEMLHCPISGYCTNLFVEAWNNHCSDASSFWLLQKYIKALTIKLLQFLWDFPAIFENFLFLLWLIVSFLFNYFDAEALGKQHIQVHINLLENFFFHPPWNHFETLDTSSAATLRSWKVLYDYY